MQSILTVDIGTSSLKVILFDDNLRIVAQSKHEYPTAYPGFRCAEQDPEIWCRALKQAITSILGISGIKPGHIAGIGIDGMSSLMLPVDKAGTALRPALIWLDRRAQAESDFIHRHHESAQIAINGNRSDPSNFGPKAMWLRDHEPDLYRAAACLLHCNAFLVHRLTGVFTMDRSEAGLSQLCDIRTGAYSDDLIAACGLDRRKLPGILGCSEIAGRVTAAAAAFGLAEGTPVIAGAMDNVAATTGLRLRRDGDAYIAAGTVTNVGVLVDQPVFDGKGLIYHYGVDGKWLVNGGVDYGGAGLLWFRNILETVDFAQLGQLAADTVYNEHPLLFLPYMAGQRAPLWNDAASGVMLGVTPGTQRRHLVRMFMESAALGARHVFHELQSHLPDRAALTGGITNNDQWTRIFADATGMDLTISSQKEVGNLGTAILTGVGVGLFRNAEEAFRLMPDSEDRRPDPSRKPYYDDLFAVFERAYRNLLGSLGELNELRKQYEVKK